MNRKVIKQGIGAYTVTLPIDWIRENKIEGGDEINLTKVNNDLILNTKEEKIQEKKIEYTFTDDDLIKNKKYRYINRIFAALFKSGYDEIKFISENKDILKYLKERTDRFIGYEIINESNNFIIIKSIVNPRKEDFMNIYNRSFIILKTISQTLISKLESNDLNYSEIIDLEKTNNKITDYLKRILAKITISDSLNTRYYYSIIAENERICDEYKYLTKQITKLRMKFPKEVINVLKQIHKSIELLIKLINKYDDLKIKEIVDIRTIIIEDLSRKSIIRRMDKDILIYINNIIIMVYEICEPIIEMNLHNNN